MKIFKSSSLDQRFDMKRTYKKKSKISLPRAWLLDHNYSQKYGTEKNIQ